MPTMKKLLFSTPLASFLLLLTSLQVPAQERLEFEADLVADELRGPVALASGGGMLWVAEKSGAVLRVDPVTGAKKEVGRPNDLFQPLQMGLYGMVLDPNFDENSHIYLYYSYIRTYADESWAHLAKVVRFRYSSDTETIGEPRTILDSISSVAWQAGGGMTVLDDRTLLVGTGDGIDFAGDAQGTATTRGKILRVGLDGSVPEDNPFTELAFPLNTIYAIGFRNVTTLASSADGDRLYGVDWGTASLDELNVIEAGHNYGWDKVLGVCDGHPLFDELDYCDTVEVADPYYEWYKTEGRISQPFGLLEYEGEGIPHWNGVILVSTALEGLHAVLHDPTGTTLPRHVVYTPEDESPLTGRALRNLVQLEDGTVYGTTWSDPADGEGPDGGDVLYRITDADEPTSEETGTPLQMREVARDLDIPWEVTWGPDHHLWMTERTGTVSRLDPESGEKSILYSFEPALVVNTGLLGMALHPNFCDTPHVYLVYTYWETGEENRFLERLSRFTYEEENDTLIDETVLLDGINVSNDHAGSRLEIATDRTLYMTTGDANRTDSTQSIASLVGSVLRMNLDGSPPADNPFVDEPWPAPLIWSYGHRNPQGLHLASNGVLYSSEHGPATDDEVNIIEVGRNYGWADVLGYCDTPFEMRICEEQNIAEPLMAWSPTIAPSDVAFYDHDAIPEWKGSLLLSVLKNRRIIQMKLNEAGDSVLEMNDYFAYEYGRIRDIAIAPDGRLFLAVSNRDVQGTPRPGDDRILELSAATGHPELPPVGSLCDRLSVPENSRTLGNSRLEVGNVYPQPVRTEGRLDLGRVVSPGRLEVYNGEGRKVLDMPTEGGDQVRFDRGDLPDGAYWAEVHTEDVLYRFRLILQ